MSSWFDIISGFKFSQLEMSTWIYSHKFAIVSHTITEVVLSVLLASFRFSVSEKAIAWKMNGIAGPVVEGTEERQSLPVVMSLAN